MRPVALNRKTALFAGDDRGIDPAAAWLALRVSPAAPPRVGSMLELDGYLTGVIVAPSPIAPGRWAAPLWGEQAPFLDDEAELSAALGSVMARYNTLGAEIDAGLERLMAERVCGWRPLFQPPDGKPNHAAVRQWAEGFWKAATLDPAGWSACIEDERTQIIVTPMVAFVPLDPSEPFDPADNIDDLLDEAAAAIPRSILLLRKIARMRAERTAPSSRARIGRNAPCPCGSGQKHKRCCGAD